MMLEHVIAVLDRLTVDPFRLPAIHRFGKNSCVDVTPYAPEGGHGIPITQGQSAGSLGKTIRLVVTRENLLISQVLFA